MTTRLLNRTGATASRLYARFTDRAIYAAILDRSRDPILGLLEEMTAIIVQGGFLQVVSDAAECYNPAHDLSESLVAASVALARVASKREIAHYCFPLVGPPDRPPGGTAARSQAIRIDLDQAALDRKLAAAREYQELALDVSQMLEDYGVAAFSHEWLFP